MSFLVRLSTPLFFPAKLSVKTTKSSVSPRAKAKAAARAAKAAEAAKPKRPRPYNLFELISLLPKPENPHKSAKDTWKHKNGWGLKFYRKPWARYPEPCYWTITRHKPAQHGHSAKLWGILTWRGQSISIT